MLIAVVLVKTKQKIDTFTRILLVLLIVGLKFFCLPALLYGLYKEMQILSLVYNIVMPCIPRQSNFNVHASELHHPGLANQDV